MIAGLLMVKIQSWPGVRPLKNFLQDLI